MPRWGEKYASDVSRRESHQSDVRPRSVNRRVLRSDDELFEYGSNTITPVGGRYFLQETGSYDDLRFPATEVNPPGLVSDPTWDTTNGGWLFDAGSTELLYIVAQLPHTWEEGTSITPHVHWQKTTSAVGNVYWQLEYKKVPIGEVMDATFATLAATTPAVSDGDTADQHALSSFGAVTMTGNTLSDMLLMKLSRVGGNAADTYAADARLLEFDIHYRVNSFGSRGEFTK